jgi:xylan 1,4-beta-xylosidase
VRGEFGLARLDVAMGTVEFSCDLSQQGTELLHCWEHTTGSCHAPIALRADWQQQLRRCHSELGFRYVRFHGLLSDDVGTVVKHNDQLLYSFFNADQIIDFLLTIGMRPFVELSFMPTALASGSKTVFHYRGNVTPPKDYHQWSMLIDTLVRHWVDRYGIREVAEWFFEVWNEPNLTAFWTGTQKDYFKLYRVTANAIKKIDPSLKVGGPATARDEWIEEFLEFCEAAKVPVDFVTTHHYPTDALGHEDDDTETQLANSQRGILREWTQDTRRRAGKRPVYYTEWNSSSNPRDPRHDEPYAAAFVAKTALEASDLVQGYSFWTFSDIFEENYFPSVPFHGGFGLLNLHGIAKPTYRAFELLHKLGNERLLVDGLHQTVNAWVTRENARITVLLVNHALPRHSIMNQWVRVRFAQAPEPSAAWVERIDEHHANAKARWHALGEPEYLDAATLERLDEASRLTREACPWTWRERRIALELELPPHAVAALTLEFARA